MTTLETHIKISPLNRSQIVKLVRRWGGSNTDAVLDPACSYFTTPEVEGIIGYRMESNCAIIFGDPICAPSEQPILASAFHRYSKENNFDYIYIATSKRYSEWAIKTICGGLVEFGEELTFDPHINPKNWTGTHGSLVRRKVRHALKEGVQIKEYEGQDTVLENAMEQVGVAWLTSRNKPKIHISNVHLFKDREGKRWFYARHNNEVAGTLLLNSLIERKGWLMNHLMIAPNAPHGTPELLVTTALETLEKENCDYVTVGPVTGKALGKIVGLGLFSAWLSRTAFLLIKSFYHLDGLNMFWEKFHPNREPNFVLFSGDRIRLRNIISLLKGVNGMSSR